MEEEGGEGWWWEFDEQVQEAERELAAKGRSPSEFGRRPVCPVRYPERSCPLERRL